MICYRKSHVTWSLLHPPVVDESLGIVPAKALMSYFAEQIPSVATVVAKEVCEFALAKIHGRIVSFEEQVSSSSDNLILPQPSPSLPPGNPDSTGPVQTSRGGAELETEC